MSRPKRTIDIDLTQAHDLTAGLIERLTCPADKQQAFLRDAIAPGLRVRVTNTGHKSFVFEAKLNRQTIRRTIGDVRAWSIKEARAGANRLRVTFDSGTDPRELERQQTAERAAHDAASVAQAKAESVTFGEAWAAYVADRRPYWGEWQYQDQLTIGDAGGVKPKRGKPGALTRPRPLHFFMAMRLLDVTAEVVEAWASNEAVARRSVSRRAHSCLKTFFTWCMEHRHYRHLVPENPAKTRKSKELFGAPSVRKDVLQREQLPAWFSQVRQIPNPVISAYLQCLLLTGARREEMAALKWTDVNFQWNGLELRDKIEGRRAVPLTPYVRNLIEGLPHRNEWVFSSLKVLAQDDKNAARRKRRAALQPETDQQDVQYRSASGHIEDPSNAHRRACASAGLTLTLHGLRRSFKSLSEWLELPVGVVAQIMGHKPSATAEKHYTVRPLDLLRLHHEKFEAWILEQAQVSFDA